MNVTEPEAPVEPITKKRINWVTKKKLDQAERTQRQMEINLRLRKIVQERNAERKQERKHHET